jgi:hypothetical protein
MGSFSTDFDEPEFNTEVSTKEAEQITERTQEQANIAESDLNTQRNWWQGYLYPKTSDPRANYISYGDDLSRFGHWWKGYEDAYGTLLDATNVYREDWNDTFDANSQYLDTTAMQQEWLDYMARIEGYYGDAHDSMGDVYAGYQEDWVDKEAYDLWGDLATGDNQAQEVQDWYAQSTQGQYLEDQANENFWRQAQLGGQTYNPQDVQEFISQSIVAPEAQQAFSNLAQYASLQPQLDWQVVGAMNELEKWYAEALAQGDTYATSQISDLMNQMNQQMWQSSMTQGLGDAELQYLIEGQMPATRTMDYTNQMLAHKDALAMFTAAGTNAENQFEWLMNSSMPNAYDSFLWESGMYEAALMNQEEALQSTLDVQMQTAAMAAEAQMMSAGIGALGSIAGAI